ncbi:L,D-transpeptidase family protein [Streptomyces brevispora]|uniref:L,D-transpeptidase family protein n=1 Tax=Streptomyces brevispora TaxID=887462 RepID=UPI002E378E24|nr:L,D-transpeptidase family protein [Streptomyces brevispora]
MSVPRSSVPPQLPYVVCAVLVLLLAGCGTGGFAGTGGSGARTKAAGAPEVPGPPGSGAPSPAQPSSESSSAGPAAVPPGPSPAPPREIPGLGPRTRAEIPAGTRQAFVVTGDSPDSSLATAVLYTRDGPAADWRAAAAPWPAHNALNGWTAEHWEGDLRTPVGVFTLTSAGGRLDPPATVFPYDLNPDFKVEGEGFQGEPLEGSFDYVIAIDYNRLPGTSPLDHTRPLGTERGGGIWIHVDHGGPTQGCVSITYDRMRELLGLLDPAKDPVVVMGDVASLSG